MKIDKVNEIINETYDNREIPEGLSGYIMKSLTMKPSINKCKHFQEIRTMNYTNEMCNMILIIIARRLEINQYQWSFVPDSGTRIYLKKRHKEATSRRWRSD